MAGVEGEQLALDEGHQVVGGLHARHLGHLPLNWVRSTIHSLKLSTVTSRGSVGRGGRNDAITAESTKPTHCSRVA